MLAANLLLLKLINTHTHIRHKTRGNIFFYFKWTSSCYLGSHSFYSCVLWESVFVFNSYDSEWTEFLRGLKFIFFLRFAINPILLDYYKTTTTIIQWTAGRQADRQGACTRCWDIICEKETNIHSFPEFYYFVLCLPSIWQLRPIRQIFASCCPLLVKVRMRLSGVLLTINRNTYIHTYSMNVKTSFRLRTCGYGAARIPSRKANRDKPTADEPNR